MLNKTRKVSAKKTKSAPRLLAAALLLACFSVVCLTRPNSQLVKKCQGTYIGALCFSIEKAETKKQRQMGLSGREYLEQNSAMLFVFPEVKRECMWMSGMQFPIDMIWLNENQDIIKIENNVSSDTYPRQFCGEETKYVIEMNAGLAKSLNLFLGEHISL